MTERIIATTTHGRYLVIPSAASAPPPMLVGFHGYGEDAETQLERLRAIPGSASWVVVSIQALHRFYERRTNRVVASWMTRQDRESAIADNLAYVQNCMEAISTEWPATRKIVFAGFSQGVAMAFRAATHFEAGVIAVGGDVPPELAPDALKRLSGALIVRGASDEWYKKAQFAADELRLRESSVNVRAVEFDGGHEWSGQVAAAASDFLATSYPASTLPQSR
jgi:predicted esterase